jgi:hypothetical protein
LERRRDLRDEGVVRKAKIGENGAAVGGIAGKRVDKTVGWNCRALSRAAFLQLYLLDDCFTGLIHRNGVLEAV